MPDAAALGAALEALTDDYEVGRELGRGGTAVVYGARDRALARTVALKVVVPDEADADALDRLAREARTAAQLVHPNIVAVHAVRRLPGGALALVMQFVSGESLRARLLAEGAFEVPRAVRALADVARGLQHAHARGVVHGDVKPENVLVDGATGRALLSDFGSATGGDPEYQERAILAGTPAYMSPEQIAGETVDARSDVYSLGLLGWELLTGLQPFGHGSPREILERRRFMSPPPLHEMRAEVPMTLAAAIERAIAPRPDDRWPSAEAFLTALAEPPRSGVFGRWRRPAGARAGGPVPAAVIAADTMVWDRPVPPLAAASPLPTGAPLDGVAAAPASQPRRGLRLAVGVGALLVAGAAWAIGARVGFGDAAAGDAVAAIGAPATDNDRSGVAVPFADSARADSSALAATQVVPGDQPPALPPAQPPDATRGQVEPLDPPVTPPPMASPPTARESFGRLPAPPRGQTAAVPAPRPSQPSAPVVSAPPPRVVAAAPPPASPTPTPPARSSVNARTVAAGGQHSCVLDAGGQAYCWGSNGAGQLGGRGSATGELVPVAGGLRFTALVAGGAFSCGVTAGRQVWCWGQNDRGQLGDGSRITRRAPVRVALPGTLRALSAGLSHACALDTAGGAWCWGANARGQAGQSEGDVLTPRLIPGDASFRGIAVGWEHSCAIDSREQAWCWGRNDDGRLGDGTTADRSVPVLVDGAPRLTSLVAGGTHSCGLTSAGQAYCWGRNPYGQLGDGTLATSRTPVRVRGAVTFASLTAGSTHTCGLTAAGEARCWGRNAYGQLGDGTTTDRATPAAVDGDFRFRQLHASGAHTCGATRDGLSLCWGYNVQGQLGDGSRSNSSRPVAVAAPPG